MEVFRVEATYLNDREKLLIFELTAYVIAKDKSTALNVYKRNYWKTSEFTKEVDKHLAYYLGEKADYNDNHLIFLDAEKEELPITKTDNISYDILLPTKEYMTASGIGNWEKILREFTRDYSYYGKFRTMIIQEEKTDNVYLFYYEGERDNKSTINAIRECETKRINPFGV